MPSETFRERGQQQSCWALTDHSVNAPRLPATSISRPWLFRLLVQSLDQKLGSRARRGRVLAGNQLAVLDRVNDPVLDLGEDCAETNQLVLDEEGYHLRQAHGFFLAIGEAGYILAVDERLVSRGLDMVQHAGGVADQGDGLACGQEGFDQLDRIL